MHLPTKAIILGFFIALSGALLAQGIGAPIPWLLGSLLATLIFRVNHAPIHSHPFFRKMGQWIIGISLGLYFTPTTIDTLTPLLSYIILACCFTLLLGSLGSLIITKLAKVDFTTAFFSSTIGGASEMVVLAERNRADKQLTASAHSLRILIVTITIPLFFQLMEYHGNTPTNDTSTSFSFEGLLLLLASSAVMGVAFEKLKIPNAFVIGSIVLTGILTAHNIHLSSLPSSLLNFAQLLIGWSLGSNYTPNFFKQAPKFLFVILITITFYLLVTIGFALLLSSINGIYYPTSILSLSPGGIAEMAITAKVLLLGAPIVTSFQISRLVFVLILAEPLYKVMKKLAQKLRLK